MVVGSRRRARALLGGRLTLLSLGAVVMMLPFAYMLATSFKPNAFVLQIPPQFIPHHPTTVELHRRLDLEPVRPLLPQLA